MNKFITRQVLLNGWNEKINHFSESHFLLSEEWAEIKSAVGWQPIPIVWENEKKALAACALILEKRIRIGRFTLPYSVLYAPKSPLMDWNDEELVKQVFSDLEQLVKKRKSIFLKIDPDVQVGRIAAQEDEIKLEPRGEEIIKFLRNRNWQYSSDQIQFRNTVWIDLSKNLDLIQAEMKQKTRYNVRLASKKGVTVRTANMDELPLLYKIYAQTAVRDGFTIRNEQYYLNVWELFINHGLCDVLVAEVEGEITAGLVLIYFGNKAYYVYGMSTNTHRNYMPTYLIQWEAILRAKKRGKQIYDLWGAPDVLNESDSMWGVYRFKRGLGGEFVSTIGAWDFVGRPIWMKIYSVIIPGFLNILRRIGTHKTNQRVETL